MQHYPALSNFCPSNAMLNSPAKSSLSKHSVCHNILLGWEVNVKLFKYNPCLFPYRNKFSKLAFAILLQKLLFFIHMLKSIVSMNSITGKWFPPNWHYRLRLALVRFRFAASVSLESLPMCPGTLFFMKLCCWTNSARWPCSANMDKNVHRNGS